jgi:two-component system response regulator YesN
MIRAMIVEDEPVHREGLARHIRWTEIGYETPLQAEDGDAALALARRTPPDVALVDVRMPGMDGIELTNRLHDVNPGLHVLIISGYDEFEFARAAVEAGASAFLLKPVKAEDVERWLLTFRQKIETRKAMEEQDRLTQEQWLANAQAARERFLEDLLREPLQDGQAVAERARSLGITMENARYLLLVIMIRPSAVADRPDPEGESLLLSRSLRAFGTAAGAGPETIAVRLDRREGAILLVFRADDLPAVDDLPERLAAAMDTLQSPGFALSVLFTPPLLDVPEIARQFARVRESPFTMNLSGDSAVLPIDAVLYGSNECGGAPALPRDAIVRRICRGQPEEALGELAIAFSIISRAGGLQAFKNAQVYAIDLVSRIHTAIRATGATTDEEVVGTYEALVRCGSIEDVHHSLAHGVRRYANSFRSVLERRKHRSVQAALDMIEKHYHESLTIKDLAEALGINASYLSTLFKEETGVTFSDHLRALRIGKAKEMLGSTSRHVYEVAEQVGFGTLAYFSSVFRKETGLTPGEYRASLSAKNPQSRPFPGGKNE